MSILDKRLKYTNKKKTFHLVTSRLALKVNRSGLLGELNSTIYFI